MYVYDYAVMTADGSTISNNTANSGTDADGNIIGGAGGGVFVTESGVVNADYCSIEYNSAGTDGGGIYTAAEDYSNLTTGEHTFFSNNSAAMSHETTATYPNINWRTVTSPFTNVLNNYDINTAFSVFPFFHVTFNTMGGSGISDKTVPWGTAVPEPNPDPSKTGYEFAGWWWNTQEGIEEEWDFNTVIHEETYLELYGGLSLVLNAKWDANEYTVTFESSGGTDVDSQTVSYGELVTEPAAPTKRGGVFAGWYTDDAFGNPWDFEKDTVSGDMTLFAKWTEIIEPSKPAEPSNPDTGDNDKLVLWVCVVFISFTMMGLLLWMTIRKSL